MFVGLLIGSIVFNHYLARLIASNRQSKTYLVAGVSSNLLFLIICKYLGLISQTLGFPDIELHLPLGVSFFTFQAISMLIDVFRGTSPSKTIFKTGLFISMFPQLIAGPIVRFDEIKSQIGDRKETWVLFRSGVFQFVLGLSQKLLLADALSGTADRAFSMPHGELAISGAWIGIVCFSLQIFYDFAGYSNMAIGIGKMFGFQFPTNFDYPYSAASFRDFWRRWHMTLSRWFRDYLYIPLGGSRGGNLKTYRNLLIVFILCGLWHGAAWTFVLWGLWHGFFLVTERIVSTSFPNVKIPRLIGTVYVWIFVSLGWVLFRAESFDHAVQYYQALFNLTNEVGVTRPINLVNSTVISLCAGLALTWDGWDSYFNLKFNKDNVFITSISCSGLLVLLLLCFFVLTSQTQQAFIYFRF